MEVDPNSFWYEATFNLFKFNDLMYWYWRSLIPIGSSIWLLVIFASYWVSLSAGILLDAIKLLTVQLFDSNYSVKWDIFTNLCIYHVALVQLQIYLIISSLVPFGNII